MDGAHDERDDAPQHEDAGKKRSQSLLLFVSCFASLGVFLVRISFTSCGGRDTPARGAHLAQGVQRADLLMRLYFLPHSSAMVCLSAALCAARRRADRPRGDAAQTKAFAVASLPYDKSRALCIHYSC